MLCTSLAVVFWPRIGPTLGFTPAKPPAAYVAGDHIDVPAAWYANSPRTLVVFARAACGACQNAQPFLKTLAAAVTAHGGRVTIAGHRDSPADDAAFAKTLGVTDDAFVVFPAGLRVRVTPTLVLVNREGVILHAWEDDRRGGRRFVAVTRYFQPSGLPATCASSQALSGAK